MLRKIFFTKLQPFYLTSDFQFQYEHHRAANYSMAIREKLLKQVILFIFGALLIVNSLSTFADLHGTLSTTSNYVYRGYSKSYDEFALQANIDYEHETGVYVGTSTSSVDFDDKEFNNPSQVEIAPYLGWSYGLSDDWRLDLRGTRYLYDGNIFGKKSDYNEFYLFLHYRDLISANISFSEDYYNRGKSAQNYEITSRYPLTDYLQISSTVGYSQTKKTLQYDYLYWNAGLTFSYKFAAFDFRYVDATEIASDKGYLINNQYPYVPAVLKPSFLFTVSVGF